jgi:hypothetical protein
MPEANKAEEDTKQDEIPPHKNEAVLHEAKIQFVSVRRCFGEARSVEISRHDNHLITFNRNS